MRPHVLSQRQRVDSGYVEWDDTPSFANSLPERLNWRERASNTITQDVYPDTCPSELMPVTQPSEFTEPVEGLSVREVQDPDVFLHFFAS